MVLLAFSEEDFLNLGLKLAGNCDRTIERTCYKTKLARFEAKYYACPATCCAILWDLQTTDVADAQVDNPNPRHLLIALNFLKEYPTERNKYH